MARKIVTITVTIDEEHEGEAQEFGHKVEGIIDSDERFLQSDVLHISSSVSNDEYEGDDEMFEDDDDSGYPIKGDREDFHSDG